MRGINPHQPHNSQRASQLLPRDGQAEFNFVITYNAKETCKDYRDHLMQQDNYCCNARMLLQYASGVNVQQMSTRLH